MTTVIFAVLALIIIYLMYDNRKLEMLSNHLIDKYREEQNKVRLLETIFNVNQDDYMEEEIND